MPSSVSQSLELSLKIKRVLMYHKKMDSRQETIKCNMVSTLKREITRIVAMSNRENDVKVYLRNYLQMHSFIMTNKMEHF